MYRFVQVKDSLDCLSYKEVLRNTGMERNIMKCIRRELKFVGHIRDEGLESVLRRVEGVAVGGRQKVYGQSLG